MAILTNSYGDTGEIAALVPRYDNGSAVFDTTTRPTLLHVESLVDQISSLVNAMLSECGFTIPVDQSDVVLSLDFFVNQEVAAIAEGINGSGRFGPTSKGLKARGRFALIVEDVKNFIDSNKIGFERLGAARPSDLVNSIDFRDTDNSGDSIFPIFQREGYGNKFKDWDPS